MVCRCQASAEPLSCGKNALTYCISSIYDLHLFRRLGLLFVFDDVHDEVGGGFEGQEEDQSSHAIFGKMIPKYDGEVHGQDAGVREEHDGADVGFAAEVVFEIVAKREAMVYGEDGDADDDNEYVDGGEVGSLLAEEGDVAGMKQAIVEGEEGGDLALGGFGGGDGFVVDREALGGEPA